MINVKKKVAFRSRRRGRPATNAASRNDHSKGRIPRVARLMALAIHFDDMLRSGQVHDQSELARLVHVSQPRMTQILNLLHLAPDIQESLLNLPCVMEGPDLLTERHVRSIVGRQSWREQRQLWHESHRGNKC
ncbi:MAG: hypothetical protein WD294_04005 [Phycisphaeraceae bacterium]